MFTVLSRQPHTMREMAPVRQMIRSFSSMRSYRIIKSVGIVNIPPV